MNYVIVGRSGSGKSTAIRRVLYRLAEPIYGFWTEKAAPDFDGAAPVFIHGCREALSYAENHLIGFCKEHCAQKFPQTFDEVGIRFLEDIPTGALVLMDEIGVMENDAKQFQAAVFRILDGNYRTLLAVRDRSTPLLDAIRSHPKSCCIAAQEANTPAQLEVAVRMLRR